MEEPATELVYCVALFGSFGDLRVSEADLVEASYSATVLCSVRNIPQACNYHLFLMDRSSTSGNAIAFLRGFR